jgi:PAS domain S-box-containing protein
VFISQSGEAVARPSQRRLRNFSGILLKKNEATSEKAGVTAIRTWHTLNKKRNILLRLLILLSLSRWRDSFPIDSDNRKAHTGSTGIGEEWWNVIEGFPLHRAFEDALIAPDTARWLPAGGNAGGLGFFVATPVRSCTGLPLGLLILADHAPRPGFSDADRQSLRTLVNAFTANLELRALAAHALESELRLLETKKRFRAIANSAPVLIIYGGPDGAPMFVNRRWLEFTGRSMKEEIGDGWSDSIQPQYRQSAREAVARAFEEHTPFTYEYPFLRRDGEYRWMRGHGTPRYLENGTFMGYVGCLIDVTDYHDAVTEIARLKLSMAVPV